MAVPGSNRFLRTWISEHVCPRKSRALLRLPDDDPMQKYRQKVPLRKGEMVIWQSETAHCNFPNYSSKMRLIQFIRCLTATRVQRDKDRYAPDRIIHQLRDDPFTDWTLPFLTTPLARKLVCLEPWETEGSFFPDASLYEVKQQVIHKDPHDLEQKANAMMEHDRLKTEKETKSDLDQMDDESSEDEPLADLPK